MSYWIIVHLIVRHCLNEASIPHCRVICLHGRASTKSRTRTLEFSFMCSCCIKNSLPMWIRLSHAGLSLKMTLGVTDFFFFFQCPGSVFLALSFTLRFPAHSFQILQPGKRRQGQSKGFMPMHARTLAVHTHTHTFPQIAVCEIDFKIKVYLSCLKKIWALSSAFSLGFVFSKSSW